MDENPYLSPTTMPDGSTRRPIVERVEEIRKAAGISHPSPDVMIGEYETDLIFWHDRDDAVGHLPRPVVALALCRVAVEDWILSLGIDSWSQVTLRTRDKGSHDKIVCEVEGQMKVYGHCTHDGIGDGPESSSSWEEGINKALNAAAHAVADALGVAP